ncbi:hypothetical protein PIB30_037613 [Stylosanthes scabra]|uniref:Uncharacterized protein n=1 Tax=Stylosanthes scabra TaxID=79078 RepID=A0ABU6ZAP0_9FABA|nr:hypothetical protein [Stylosanthes scabra]
MPYELYKFLGLGPFKKTEEIFINVDASVVLVVGIVEVVKVKIGGLTILADFHVIKPGKKDNRGTPQVLLGRPFLKSGGFKLNYDDEIFTFEVGNTKEIFHFDDSSELEKKGLHQLRHDKKNKKKKREARKRKKRENEEADKKCWLIKTKTISRKEKKKKALSTLEEEGNKGSRKYEQSLQMVHTRSDSLAKGNAKLCRPSTRASPRLAALRSNTAMQIPTPTPNVLVKEAVTSTLPPKKQQNFRMAGESSSRRDTKIPCRRSRRLAALYSVTKPVSEEKVVIEISDDLVQEKDTNLEQHEALPVAEGGGGEDLPKNDVYDALWAMLDAELGNEAEEIPGEWDLDSVLQNWGRNEPDVGPAGPDQGPHPTEIQA